jgi:hypothetical protein
MIRSSTHVQNLLALASLCACFGCMRNTYTTGLSPGGPRHVEDAPFFLFGLIGDVQIHLDELCPDGVAWFQNRTSPGNCLLSLVTLGVYTPRTVEVRCAGGLTYRIQEDPGAGGSWVTELWPTLRGDDDPARDRR